MHHSRLTGHGDAADRLGDRGYAVIPGVLDIRQVLDPVLECLYERVKRCYGSSTPASASPHERLSAALVRLAESGRAWSAQDFDIALPPGPVAADTPVLLEPAIFALLSAPALLDLVESVIGPEVWLSPVGHVRLKTPESLGARSDGITGRVPWHQDNGVLLPEADDVEILTAWIPMATVTKASGCLQVHPSPAATALAGHCPGVGGLRIPERLLPDTDPVAIEMEPGAVLLMHSRTVHSSLPNLVSRHVRVSFDLRYQRAGSPSGRPQFPSFLLRTAGPEPVTTFEGWRDGWLASRDQAAASSLGPFSRWSTSAPMCA